MDRQPHASSPDGAGTFWAVYCFEIFTCCTLGWPSSLKLCDVDIPAPDRGTFAWALFQTCEIMQLIHTMYRQFNTTIKSDLQSAYKILKKSQSLLQSLKDDMGIEIGKLPGGENSEKLIQHIILSYHYFYIICLTFRPFLLLSLEIMRCSNKEKDENAQGTLLSINSTLQDGCERSIDAACSMIALAEMIFTLHPKAEGVCNHELFLEAACFVLVLEALRVKSSYTIYGEYIKQAVRCLRQMSHRKRLVELISALEQLLTRVEFYTSNPDLARAASSFPLSEESGHRYKGGYRTIFNIPRESESQIYPLDSAYPLFGDTLMGFSGAEETLLSLEQIPDAQWPSIDWNLDLLSINPDFFEIFPGAEENADLL